MIYKSLSFRLLAYYENYSDTHDSSTAIFFSFFYSTAGFRKQTEKWEDTGIHQEYCGSFNLAKCCKKTMKYNEWFNLTKCCKKAMK